MIKSSELGELLGTIHRALLLQESSSAEDNREFEKREKAVKSPWEVGTVIYSVNIWDYCIDMDKAQVIDPWCFRHLDHDDKPVDRPPDLFTEWTLRHWFDSADKALENALRTELADEGKKETTLTVHEKLRNAEEGIRLAKRALTLLREMGD